MMTLLLLTSWGRKNIAKTVAIGLVFDIFFAQQLVKFLKFILTTI